MKLIVGLGNPDKEYEKSRHNVGHMLVDSLGERGKGMSKAPTRMVGGSREWKAEKTDVYMNESGEFVAKQKNFYKISLDDLYVVYDDLDIPLGGYKISKGKSPRVHNGILSVIEKLGTEDFWHVRIGIEHRTKDKEQRQTGKEYVLSDFTKEEKPELEKVIGEVVEHLTQSFAIAK